MRITLKEKYVEPEPEFGDRQERSAFLFFPKIINRELRWLEKAYWVERYSMTGFSEEYPFTHRYKWVAERWGEENP